MTGIETKFENALSMIRDSDGLHSRVRQNYRILKQVQDSSEGHGTTFALRRNKEPSKFDYHEQSGEPYNGVPHNLDDHDITDVISENRWFDLVNVVDSDGYISHRGVYLDVSGRPFMEEYGLNPRQLAEFMGYPSGYPGSRKRSHLYASHEMGEDVVFMTLGETDHEGNTGPIEIFYNGDRIFSEDKEMHWELAKKLPPTRTEPRQLSFDFYAEPVPEKASESADSITYLSATA